MVLKSLVGVAAVAIIAFVGYYFWNEYRDSQQSAAIDQASLERAACLVVLDSFSRSHSKDLLPRITSCGTSGAITPAEISAASN